VQWAFLLLSALFVVGLWWYSLSLEVKKLTIPVEGLPHEFAGFRIAHISDLHGKALSPDGALARAIREARADIVTITGDFVTKGFLEVQAFLPFLESLSSELPVYAVSGNHDHDAGWEQVAAKLRSVGVTVLDDAHVAMARAGSSVYIVGVRDPFSGRGNLAQAMPPESKGEVCLLLAHSPSYFEAFAKTGRFRAERAILRRVALTLCGHTHGGQIKLPLVGAVTNGSQRLFPRDYVEGLSWEGTGWLYISRGIGWVILPLRFLSRPEVAIITLVSRRDGAIAT